MKHSSVIGREGRTRDALALPAAGPAAAGGAGACRAVHASASLDPLLSADAPTSPKKSKSVPQPAPGDVEGEAIAPPPSEWTSVRISPGEDVVGQDVLAVRVLVTSDDDDDDSRYVQAAAG